MTWRPVFATCFYEHIPETLEALKDMPRWFSDSDVLTMKEIFSYMVGEEGYQRILLACDKHGKDKQVREELHGLLWYVCDVSSARAERLWLEAKFRLQFWSFALDHLGTHYPRHDGGHEGPRRASFEHAAHGEVGHQEQGNR